MSTAGGPGTGFRQGPVTLACEIDAKPAGHLGFLRVWSQARTSGSTQQVLDAFLAGQQHITERHNRRTTAGVLPAVETTYLVADGEQNTAKRERALAVATPHGVILLHLGGLDTTEHAKMLPAFVLARRALTALTS
ncbi:hypothetical protein QFZ49_003314 [Streptomyces turgidiscabies]|uniref:Transposase n=1 Tax=Streptomyces turgidiscabies TaxID=85558 RepID=A0ABU0RN28_9ACTN|nr:hypothetical protein [Streptomyces turgidiscabies]